MQKWSIVVYHLKLLKPLFKPDAGSPTDSKGREAASPSKISN